MRKDVVELRETHEDEMTSVAEKWRNLNKEIPQKINSVYSNKNTQLKNTPSPSSSSSCYICNKSLTGTAVNVMGKSVKDYLFIVYNFLF